MGRLHAVWALAVGALLLGCGHTRPFVWVDAYEEPPLAKTSAYVVGPGDVVNVRVFGQDGLSARVRVRPDGKISLPFANEVDAAGLEPLALAARVQVRLKEFVVNPVVTVSLDEPAPMEISVVGEVSRPGIYKLEPGAGVLNAIAVSGGLTEYAKRDQIFVLRYGDRAPGAAPAAAPARIRMTYDALAGAQGRAATLRLRKGDVVVVE